MYKLSASHDPDAREMNLANSTFSPLEILHFCSKYWWISGLRDQRRCPLEGWVPQCIQPEVEWTASGLGVDLSPVQRKKEIFLLNRWIIKVRYARCELKKNYIEVQNYTFLHIKGTLRTNNLIKSPTWVVDYSTWLTISM